MKVEIPKRGSILKNKYSAVHRQQGRMLTDSDWNAFVEIIEERLHDVHPSQIKLKIGLSQYRRSNMALFSGLPEVVKSRAASVIANELGWPLLGVDMKQLVSQSSIETEQNIHALFDKALDQPWVLYFDEADSLFGRRSEVKDAHDRYTDMETNGLLSRIERYKKGLCIVSVTSRQKVSVKHLRRFRYKVNFAGLK